MQETFLTLWNRAELFDPTVASLATWLRSIARNRTVDRLRAKGRRPTLVSLRRPGDADDADQGVDRLSADAVVIGGAGAGPGSGGGGRVGREPGRDPRGAGHDA